MDVPGFTMLRALLAVAVLVTASRGTAETRQDEIVNNFDRYVKTSVQELEDLQGLITEHRQSMEHGEEIVGGSFHPLPPLGIQTTTPDPTTTSTIAASATSEEPDSGTTRKPWNGFLKKWTTTTQEPWTTTQEPWTTTQEPWTTTQEPWTTTQEPWTTTQEPWTTTREPWTTQAPWSWSPTRSWAQSNNNWEDRWEPQTPAWNPPPRKQFKHIGTLRQRDNMFWLRK